jgi:micrococcal nuclease
VANGQHLTSVVQISRLLAYVWVERARKPVMANVEMVRLGFAQVMTIPPNVKYQGLFLRLQREARDAGRGLWGEG